MHLRVGHRDQLFIQNMKTIVVYRGNVIMGATVTAIVCVSRIPSVFSSSPSFPLLTTTPPNRSHFAQTGKADCSVYPR